MSKPVILVTNDDGLLSPGLHAAIEAVQSLGEVVVAAPVQQQSGMGRSLPAFFPCTVTEHRLKLGDGEMFAYGVDGSPAQAVLQGILSLCEGPPALVVAGVNHGENLGTSSMVSGTVGAALQAAVMGVPGLAVSLEVPPDFHFDAQSGDATDWTAAIHFTRYFAERMLLRAIPADVDVLKIDIPSSATKGTPWRVTRQARQPYYHSANVPEELTLGIPRRLPYYVHIDWDVLPRDSDIWAFARDRVVSVTPLSIDMTSRVDLSTLETLLA